MPKLPPKTQAERRDRILDAAEACFVENGFHPTTMQDICRRADISSGALYTYFVSKEQLIAGLCERENERLSGDLARLAEVPDFLAALQSLAEHYCCQEPIGKVRLHIEIGAEAGRNEAIGEIIRDCDIRVRASFTELLEREQAAGRIRPNVPIAVVVRAMGIIGDGLFWHRSLDPNFDPNTVIEAMMAMISTLLFPPPSERHLP